MKSIKKILEKHGINPSYQRIIIYKYLIENQIHPSIDQIYNSLKENNPTLSKTTVYNTIRLFIENGILSKIYCDDKEMRYDINTHNHMHFVCDKCGEIYDIKSDNKVFQIDEIQGHKINHTSISFRGICKNCRD